MRDRFVRGVVLLAVVGCLSGTAVMAAVSVPEANCSAGQALKLVQDGDAAAQAKKWLEARRAYQGAEAALRNLISVCPSRADQAQVLLDSLKEPTAKVDEGLLQTVCAPAIQRAQGLDQDAAGFRGTDWTAVERLSGQAEAAWKEAGEACSGDKRESALKAASAAARQKAEAEQQLARSSCGPVFEEAGRFMVTAREAWADGRWQDAQTAWGQAGKAWSQAGESCLGARQVRAREEAGRAGAEQANASRCGPAWGLAVAESRRLKELRASLSLPERQALHDRVEIRWRDAAGVCQGDSGRVAAAWASTLAWERGKRSLPSLAELPEITGASQAPQVVPEINVKAGDTTFVGQFARDANNLTVSGTGKVAWDNGNVFEGMLVHGKARGLGRMAWHNGDRYQGQWRDDQPNGDGRMDYANGSRYQGEFLDGRPNGVGRYDYPGGSSYVGEFRGGRPEGWGVFTWGNGDHFEGYWKNGLKEGPGRFSWANGQFQEGWYKADQPVPAPN